MVGTVNMLLTRWRSTSCQISSASKRVDAGSTVQAARATWVSRWMPAPCDSGATARLTSCSVVPGMRSHR